MEDINRRRLNHKPCQLDIFSSTFGECTQLSVTMCMSSATGTLHVLEICAIEQIRRMC